jgi:Fic family protein
MDPVVAAAAVAFGFVYIHPFEDGNGRLHRWLIHHVLARAGYNPPGVIFPVSAAILREIDAYRRVLESCSAPLLPLIEWRATETGNVEVLNETADHYRYFDATAHAEFLYRCVRETVERDLPAEVAYLEAYDRFVRSVQEIVDMPASTVDLLHRFLCQNAGRLSNRARTREFAALTDREVALVERLYAEAFEDVALP